MKSLKESLFGDNITSDITTLYDLFGSHIKKFKRINGEGLGWTHFFDQPAVVREWKKEGRPALSGGFAKTTFAPDLQKFIAVILKNSITSIDQIISMSGDGNLDDRSLNDKLEDCGILLPIDSKWGATASRRLVRVQVSYISNHWDGVKFDSDQVGWKRIKGLDTDKIEITIYCYDPKSPGFGSHVWTLLTDLSINDLK